jgi:hypothetical protein
MGYLLNAIMTVPIGILYNIFVTKLSEIMTTSLVYEDRIQKHLIFCFIGGLVGYVLAMTIFEKDGILENTSAKYGIAIGSSILILNSLISNWMILQNDTKLFIIGMLFVFSLVISYKFSNETYQKDDSSE